jgi:hypothetical protein
MSAKLPSPSVISSQPYPFWLGGEYSPFCFGVVLTSASLAVHSNHSAQGWPQPLQPLLPSTFRCSVMVCGKSVCCRAASIGAVRLLQVVGAGAYTCKFSSQTPSPYPPMLHSLKSKWRLTKEREKRLQQAWSTAVSGLQTTLSIAKDVTGVAGVPGLQAGISSLLVVIDIIKVPHIPPFVSSAHVR